MQQKYWWKLQKGTGIKVQIPNDIDKETGKQKYRPAIVIKSYPSHVKVQLMTTEQSTHDYFKIKIDNQIQYIRPIYYRTIPIEWVNRSWKDKNNKLIVLNKTNKFFQNIAEKEYIEILGQKLNFVKENKLKKQICVQTLKLKNRNRG
ncbi:MAG: hypothetical protein PPFGHCPK_01484 (plasmid) [Spiroplasma endosymbiont of Drosophila atripex]|nr:MAG: hypothetical protein PPFGHCPK_01484 [Spiroplasma endosymbiont of Drosophila atripex]